MQYTACEYCKRLPCVCCRLCEYTPTSDSMALVAHYGSKDHAIEAVEAKMHGAKSKDAYNRLYCLYEDLCMWRAKVQHDC